MLKFFIDEKKEKTFLSFWNIKNLDEYQKISNDIFLFFTYYVSLSNIAHQIVANFVKNYLKEFIFSLKDSYLVLPEKQKPLLISPFLEDQALMKTVYFLDEIDVISIQKDRSYLESKKDVAIFSKNFCDFLKSIFVIEENLPKEMLSKNTLKNLTYEEKSYLEQFNFLYAKSCFLKEEQSILLSLLKKKCLLFGFTKDFKPIVFLNSVFFEENKKPISHAHTSEKTSLFLSTVDEFIYELHLKKKIRKDHFLFQKKGGRQAFVLARFFFRRKKYISYLKKPFHLKVQFLLENFFSYGFEVLLVLISNASKSKGFISKKRLFHEMNKKRILDQKELINYALFHKEVDRLDKLAFISEQRDFIFFSKKMLRYVLKETINNKLGGKKKPKLNGIIDTDGMLTLYKSKTCPSILYYLSLFTKLNIADYTIQASFDLKKLSLAWFCHFYPKKIKFFLSKIAPDYYNDFVSKQVNSFFKQLETFKKESIFAIRTYSKELYKHTKLILEEKLSEKAEVIFLKKHGIILFLKEEDYKKAIYFLKEKKWVVF